MRIFLELTGFPQVGGSTLHIAHVLWGGLLMAVGLMIMFIFLGSLLESLGILAGGIGFGLFIDEVGKFVTRDNDYFFQPSVAIMYTTFVVLYLGARWILTSTRYSQNEYLVNSINELRDLCDGKATEEEKKLVLYTLGKCDPHEPLVDVIRHAVERHGFQRRRTRRLLQQMANALFCLVQAADHKKLVHQRWSPPSLSSSSWGP